MNTIEALELDIKLQENLIKKFKPHKPISKTLQNQLIFCGTGDSFVAALLTEVFSNFNVRAYDPLELINNKYILQNKRIFLVSISGSTRSNIKDKFPPV